jgi:hypothetical protein
MPFSADKGGGRCVRPSLWSLAAVTCFTLSIACSSEQSSGADGGPPNSPGADGSNRAGASNAGGSNHAGGGGSSSGGGTSNDAGSSGGPGNGGDADSSASNGSGGSAASPTSNGGRPGAAGSAGSMSQLDGSAPDPCATARFCETFESYPTGKPPGGGWKTQTNLGAVSVVDTAHFGGSKSVLFNTQAGMNGKTAYIRLDLAAVFPVPGNAYYGRMMTRLESAPQQSVHWTFIQSGGLVPSQNYHALYRYGGQQPLSNGGTFIGTTLMANYETPDSYSGTGPSSDCWNQSNGNVMPVGKWTCVEWQFDGQNDTMRFWLDGVAIDSLTVQGKGQGCVHQDKSFEWKAPAFDNLELGWESYQADSERTLYVDDVVLATTRIGCPPP